ncbi:hypothetical protein GW17_00005522 [Ensete ventricosum]|nr:hypothetical protein GW17_00005522 [Ensete ventricosum]
MLMGSLIKAARGSRPRLGLLPAKAAAPTGAAFAQGGTARPRGAARGQQRQSQGQRRRAAPPPTKGSGYSGTCDAVAGDHDA